METRSSFEGGENQSSDGVANVNWRPPAGAWLWNSNGRHQEDGGEDLDFKNL